MAQQPILTFQGKRWTFRTTVTAIVRGGVEGMTTLYARANTLPRELRFRKVLHFPKRNFAHRKKDTPPWNEFPPRCAIGELTSTYRKSNFLTAPRKAEILLYRPKTGRSGRPHRFVQRKNRHATAVIQTSDLASGNKEMVTYHHRAEFYLVSRTRLIRTRPNAVDTSFLLGGSNFNHITPELGGCMARLSYPFGYWGSFIWGDYVYIRSQNAISSELTKAYRRTWSKMSLGLRKSPHMAEGSSG